jgi:predicted transcriptional regulator
MKIIRIAILTLLPAAAAAQPPQGMSEQDMQKMMQQMQEFQACMQDVDQAKMKQLEQRSKQFNAEIKSLCAKGKRDEAQQKAMAMYKKMSNDPVMKKLTECGKKLKDAAQQMPFTMPMEEHKDKHVCDQDL